MSLFVSLNFLKQFFDSRVIILWPTGQFLGGLKYYMTPTGTPKWYWLTVGQGLLSLQQVRVEAKCCCFFCSFAFFHFPSFFPIPHFHLLYYLSSLFSLSLGDNINWPTRVDISLNSNTHTQKKFWNYMLRVCSCNQFVDMGKNSKEAKLELRNWLIWWMIQTLFSVPRKSFQ